MKRTKKFGIGIGVLAVIAATAAQISRPVWAYDDASGKESENSSNNSSADSDRDSKISSYVSTGVTVGGLLTTVISLVAGNQHRAEALIDQAVKGDGDELRLLAFHSGKSIEEVSDIVLDVEPSRPITKSKLSRLQGDLSARLQPKKAAK